MKRSTINALAFAYIIEAIDGEPYERELTTTEEKLEFIIETFEKEYGHQRRQYPNDQNRFAEWLKGLPSAINIEYRNHRILELAKEWGSLPQDAAKRQEDKILENWWEWMSRRFWMMCKQYGVTKNQLT